MQAQSLHDLYVEELQDIYSGETQILAALPKMIGAATHPELKQAFSEHLTQTQTHVTRLEQVCTELGVSPIGKKCVGMEGVLKEGAQLIAEQPGHDVLDAGLIAKAQHVEHYEIAGYGTVCTWAKALGHDTQAGLLQRTLDEEKAADSRLTKLAVGVINVDAEFPDRRS